jgi:uncharacterized protein
MADHPNVGYYSDKHSDIYHYNTPHAMPGQSPTVNRCRPIADDWQGWYAEGMDEPTSTPNLTVPPWQRHRWLPFVLPFAIYVVITTMEPSPANQGFARTYSLLYCAKIAVTLAAMVQMWGGYRQFPFHVSPLALLVGAVGGPLWIGLCSLNVEHAYLAPALKAIGLGSLAGGDRPGFNPFDVQYALPVGIAWTFLAIRFLGLALVVPVIEEFFLRGFLMRFVMERDWWDVPFGKVSAAAVVVGTAFPLLTHPEWLAVAVWFSMITWLMVRTRNIWDCVAAHALTNLVLGLYVVWQGGAAWRLL